jgi:phospholipid/cholesterol/gamma-HCH transport system substrate-binding protein
MNNDSLYISLAKATAQIDSLASDIEKQPKKYVHFSVFGRKK